MNETEFYIALSRRNRLFEKKNDINRDLSHDEMREFEKLNTQLSEYMKATNQ